MTGDRACGGRGRHLLDLSHPIVEGLETYPGLPTPAISSVMTREQSRSLYAPGTEFQVDAITLCGNTGTYVDSPRHRFADGADLAELPLEQLADLEGVVVDVSSHADRRLTRRALSGRRLRGRAVLVRTGWSRHWGTPAYGVGHPYLTADAARHLVEQGAVLVGIDALNVDDTDDGHRPVHTILLGAGIPVCEHLTALDRLPAEGFRFSAVPVPVRGMGTFPVRAYAVLEAG